jgi:hypothetical protein
MLPARRLLLLPAIALVLLAAPVLALEGPSDTAATTSDVPIAPVGETVPLGWQSAEVPVTAELVGVQWEGAPDAEFTIETQTADGVWSPATSLGADVDGQADPGTKDAVKSERDSTIASEPIWLGEDAQAVRVTLASGEASSVSLAAVEAPSAAAPDGSAGAAAAVFGATLNGPERFAFGGAVAAIALVLIAVALRRVPRRRARRPGVRRLVPLFAAVAIVAGCAPIPAPGGGGGGGSGGAIPGAPPIISRAQWGARPFGCAGGPEYAPYLKSAIIHHTVNSNNYSAGSSPSMVRGIQAYHMDANGYCDIAYHFIVDRYGQIFEGRDGGMAKPVIGGHAGGFNTGSTGVALLGDNTSAGITPPQWNALVSLLRWRLSAGRLDPSLGFVHTVGSSPCNCMNWPPGTFVAFPNAIVAHRDVDQTSCPGNAAYNQLGALRNEVQAGISFPPSAEVSFGSTIPAGANGVKVFTRAPGGAVIERTRSGGSWTQADLGGAAASKIVALETGGTSAMLLVKNTAGALAWRRSDGTTWSAWGSAGGTLASDPAAAVDGSGNVHVVVRGTDGAFWRTVYDGSSWAPWTSLGGGLTSDPAITFNGAGELVVVGRGTGLTPYWGRVVGGVWSGWSALGGQINSDLTVVTDATGAVRVFGVGTNWEPYTGRLEAGWSGWSSLGGTITSDLTAILGPTGTVVLAGRGNDDAFYVNTLSGSAWSGWLNRLPWLASDPALGFDGAGDLWMFGVGTDGQVYSQHNDGSGWTSWAGIGGPVESVRGYT